MGIFDKKAPRPAQEANVTASVTQAPQPAPPGPNHAGEVPYRIVGVWNIEEIDGKRVHTTPNYDAERIAVTPTGHGKTYEKGDVVYLTAGLARVIQKHIILEPLRE